MDKFSELKAAALSATPGRVGDRTDGSGSIKYECVGYDGSVVLRTDHKNMEYGFVGDNSDADELFFRLCVPDVVLALLAELESKDKRIADMERVVAAAKCDDELWDAMAHRLKTMEAKLATPVRLKKVDSSNVPFAGDGFNAAVDYCAAGVRAAGFSVTVEGDE
ncbi:ead/Ea22-like family protein [Serratia odorifera]|uniref:ead/Ea22-like family protein n=1 Tax=Serratia odorifera TaxID=618 RepID=UPI003D27D4AB